MANLEFPASSIEHFGNKRISADGILTIEDKDDTYPSSKTVYNSITKAVEDSTAEHVIYRVFEENGWYVRQWRNTKRSGVHGMFECWATLTAAEHTPSNSTTGVADWATVSGTSTKVSVPVSRRQLAFPANIFGSTPKVFCSVVKGSGGGISCCEDDGSTDSDCKIVLFGPQAESASVNVYCVGNFDSQESIE
jgi:hypothetical protein